MKHIDLVIIGGGSGGMSAAIEATKKGIKNIVLLEKNETLGGILFQCIHSGFGLHHYKEELTGPEYAERQINEVRELGIDVKVQTMVLSITKDLVVSYSNVQEGYQEIKARAIVVATGCIERTRGQITLPGDRPSGVFTAGLAQRYLNIDGYMVGKKVFILGSGDIGLIMARRMVLEGAEVLGVAEMMPYSNGLTRNIVQCLHDYDIPLYLSHTVVKTIGKDRLEKVIIQEVDSHFQLISGTEKSFEVDTLLLSVGLIPSIVLLEELVKVHPVTKGPVVDDTYMTSVPGIFVCGNSLHVHDLVDFVSEEGSVVGRNVASYLMNEEQEGTNVSLEAGANVRYVVPSSVLLPKIESLTIRFRVATPMTNAYILIKQQGELLLRIKKAFLLPAEMETISFDVNTSSKEPIVVEVEDA